MNFINRLANWKNTEEKAFEAIVSAIPNSREELELEEYGSITTSNHIVCPYCFHEIETEYGDIENVPYTNCEYDCPKCEKYFEVDCEPVVEFFFSSKKVEL